MKRRRFRNSSFGSDREDVVDLMVDFWELTGKLFGGRRVYDFAGTPEDILRAIENIVDERWCRLSGYATQAEELRKALRDLDRLMDLDEAMRKQDVEQ